MDSNYDVYEASHDALATHRFVYTLVLLLAALLFVITSTIPPTDKR